MKYEDEQDRPGVNECSILNIRAGSRIRERFRPKYQRATLKLSAENQAIIDAKVKAHRDRVSAELDRLGIGMSVEQKIKRGLIEGDALKLCHKCGKETVASGMRDLKKEGWTLVDGKYTCRECNKE